MSRKLLISTLMLLSIAGVSYGSELFKHYNSVSSRQRTAYAKDFLYNARADLMDSDRAGANGNLLSAYQLANIDTQQKIKAISQMMREGNVSGAIGAIEQLIENEDLAY